MKLIKEHGCDYKKIASELEKKDIIKVFERIKKIRDDPDGLNEEYGDVLDIIQDQYVKFSGYTPRWTK